MKSSHFHARTLHYQCKGCHYLVENYIYELILSFKAISACENNWTGYNPGHRASKVMQRHGDSFSCWWHQFWAFITEMTAFIYNM